jgi:hypothetical protein
MKRKHVQRHGKWSVGIGALAIAASLVGSLAIGTNAAAQSSDWDGNGAPTFLKTAPAGTPVNEPAKNTIFSCVDIITAWGAPAQVGQDFGQTLSQANTPWVKDGRITISKIQTVPGAVRMKSVFKITETKNTRTLKGNGIPNHPIGDFAIPENSLAYKWYAALPSAPPFANAAEIPVKPYHLEVTLPKKPKIAAKPSCFHSLMIGVALTGAAWHAEVAIDSAGNTYDPNAALPTDRCFGHPFDFQYHYHGYSWKCLNQGKRGEPSPLVGYALDGFGIYGPRGADGKLVTNAQLDECHGRVGEVVFNGKKQKMYHYVLNNEYPYSVGCFRGTPRPMVGMDH